MTNFGIVYETNTLDPDSLVYLSNAITGSAVSSSYSLGYAQQIYGEREPVLFISDNDTQNELALVTYHPRLRIYDVYAGATGTPSITLRNETSFIPEGYGGYTGGYSQYINYFGVKKVSDSLYYIYYGTKELSTSGYYRFKRVAITPGVGYVDELLQEYVQAPSGFVWYDYPTFLVVGKVGYAGLLKCYPGTNNPVAFDVYIYSIDMETEAIAGGVQWQSGGAGQNYKSYLNNQASGVLYMFSSLGTFHWITHYYDLTQFSGNGNIVTHVVIDGIDTTIFDTIAGDWWALWTTSKFGTQYNSKDYLHIIEFNHNDTYPDPDTNYTHRVFIQPDGTTTTEFNFPPNEAHFSSATKFLHPNTYPTIVSSGTSYYQVDITTGLTTGDFTVPGVSTIYNMFPTLDTQDGSIYINALMSDTTKKTLGINSLTGNITRQLATLASSSSYPYEFNHGNYFLVWTASQITISYLVNLNPFGLNIVQMIIEQN